MANIFFQFTPSLRLHLQRGVTALVAIAIFMAVSFIFPLPSNAGESAMRILTVTGEGKAIIPTTLTQINLGVEVQGATSSEVQQEIAKKSTSVVNFLRSRNVQQLQTTGISLQPRYDYNSDQQKLIGYSGTNLVSFQVETSKIGDLLDRAVANGASRIDQISFTATESAIATAQKQALQAAVQNAKSQGDTVLSSLNFSSQEIVKIQINGANLPQPLPQLEATALAKNASADTPIIGSTQTVTASVTLSQKY